MVTGTAVPRTSQGAQLSRKDRTMLHVIEFFVKSLKVTQGHSNDTLE